MAPNSRAADFPWWTIASRKHGRSASLARRTRSLAKQVQYPLGRGVVGPTGDILTFANLPPSKPGRWVARRKAEVLSALMGGLVTVESLCRKYNLTEEELLSWMRAYSRRGLPGLKVKALRQKP
jgi:hypothetical protein